MERKEIHILWNPGFKYGGPISVEIQRFDGQKPLGISLLSNGFYRKSDAWEFAESLRLHEQMPIVNDCIGFGAM